MRDQQRTCERTRMGFGRSPAPVDRRRHRTAMDSPMTLSGRRNNGRVSSEKIENRDRPATPSKVLKISDLLKISLKDETHGLF